MLGNMGSASCEKKRVNSKGEETLPKLYELYKQGNSSPLAFVSAG
jgi:hypothetical protein